jgi:hypothetical protein
VLLAMDSYNLGMDMCYAYRTHEGRPFGGAQLSLFNQLGDFNHGMLNGRVVHAASTSTFAAPLRRKDNPWISQAKRVVVGKYKPSETLAMLSLWQHSGYCRGGLREYDTQRLKFMSGSVPKGVLSYACLV